MDWLLWLGPGILAVFALGALVGFCFFYHYYLPYQMLSQKDADSLMGDSFGTVWCIGLDLLLAATIVFSPFVPVTSHPDDVPTSPIDQPARCRRSWQASISAGRDITAMVIHGRVRGQTPYGRRNGSRIK